MDVLEGLQIDNLLRLFRHTVAMLEPAAPKSGPTSARQLFVTFSGVVIQYYTMAPLLAPAWGADPLSAAGLAERRAHVHWLLDVLLDRLQPASVRPG